MKNRTVSLPLGMVNRKFYCHRCGTQLTRVPRTRTVRQGDPDYRKYRHTGQMTMIGDIEVTEYNFHCAACNTATSYDDQCIIAYIQKRSGSHYLSQSEISTAMDTAKSHLARKRKLAGAAWIGLCIITAIVITYFKSRG